MTRRIDSASRLIHASPRELYRAFTTSNALERWLPPDGMTATVLAFDFREGGGYRMRLQYTDPTEGQGKTSEDTDEVIVRFTKLIADRCIEEIVTFESDDPRFAGAMHMTWTFDGTDEETLVTVRGEDVPAGISAADHQAGLQSTLRNLARLAEAGR